MKALKKLFLPILSVVLLIISIYLIAFFVGDEMIFPSPTVVIKEFVLMLKKSAFYLEIIGDLWRTVYSFFFALVFAVILAVVTSLNETIRVLFYPLIASLRAVPTIAIILWCLIIFKTDYTPAAISFIVMFPMIYNAVYSTISSRDKTIDLMADVYQIKKRDRIFKIIIPDVSLRVFPQICSLLSFNVKLIVAGEALSYTKLSLGRELQLANNNIETAKLLAVTVAVILISILVEQLFKALGEILKRGIYGYNRKKIIEKLR